MILPSAKHGYELSSSVVLNAATHSSLTILNRGGGEGVHSYIVVRHFCVTFLCYVQLVHVATCKVTGTIFPHASGFCTLIYVDVGRVKLVNCRTCCALPLSSHIRCASRSMADRIGTQTGRTDGHEHKTQNTRRRYRATPTVSVLSLKPVMIMVARV